MISMGVKIKRATKRRRDEKFEIRHLFRIHVPFLWCFVLVVGFKHLELLKCIFILVMDQAATAATAREDGGAVCFQERHRLA